jgi:hypothetical protein
VGVSLTAPWFLPAAIGFGLIAWRLYRARGDGQETVVSSLALLRKFKRAPFAKKDPKIPLRFYAECLVALLLSLILAGLAFHQKYERVLVIFDQSLSTEARIGATRKFQDELQEAALAYIESVAASTRIDLVTTVHRSIREDIDSGIFQSTIASVPAPHTDDLVALLNDLPLKEYDAIYLASDRDVILKGYTGTFIKADRTHVPPKQNIFFTDDGLTSINTTEVSGVLDAVPVTIRPQQVLGLKGEPQSAPQQHTFRPTQWQDDRIERDSQRTPPPVSDGIAVYDEDNQVADFKGLPLRYTVASLRRAGGPSLRSDEVRFIKTVPASLEQVAAQQDKNTYYQQQAGAVVSGALSWWNEESILLRYLAPALIEKLTARALECPAWMSVDLRIDGKPILCHGEASGDRVVISGLPLLPFGKGASRFLDVLTLNIFQWNFQPPRAVDIIEEESRLDTSPFILSVQTTFDTDKAANQNAPQRSVLAELFLILVLFLIAADLAFYLRSKRYFGRGL